MRCVSNIRISAKEGNHRFAAIVDAFFNAALHQSVSEITKKKKVRALNKEQLQLADNVLRALRISKVATVSMSWPSASNAPPTGGLSSVEMSKTKGCSTLVQDKKDGSVERSVRDAVISCLIKVSETSISKQQMKNDLCDVHRPGSLNRANWCLHDAQLSQTELHEEAPKPINEKDKGSEPAKKKRGSKNQEVGQTPKASNKYRNDDFSTGLEARAVVAFREHMIETILTDNCKEVLDIKQNLQETYSLDPLDANKGFDPKNEYRPRKLDRAKTTPRVLANHIGYSLTTDRSLQGCMFITKLKPDTFRPKVIWPIIFLVSNFVHDSVTLLLMIKILNSNGMPADTSSPFVVPTTIEHPQIFNVATKSYGHMIVHGFLKPQMMLYDAFLTGFRKAFTEAGEINIRNRFMLSIGKSWLKVIDKFGLWISPSRLSPFHEALKLCLETKATDFPHVQLSKAEGRGTNLPQVAACVCHLINEGVFVWSNRASHGDWKQKTGVFETPGSSPPSNWDLFVPQFKVGTIISNGTSKARMQIEDIVERAILGTCNDGAGNLDGLKMTVKAWSHATIDFTFEHCCKYIEANKKPETISSGDSEDGDEVEREKMPGKVFRTKMFAPTEYRKYFTHGDNTENDPSIKLQTKKNPDDAEIEQCRERLHDMSTSLLEASSYLRFQRELLLIHSKHVKKDDEVKFAWKFAEVMPVIQKEGGEKCRPFYHPAFPELVFKTVDREMKVFAQNCYEKAVSSATNKTSSEDSDKPAAKEVASCTAASEKGFKVTDNEYDQVGDAVALKYQKEKARIAVEVESKKRGNDAEDSDESNKRRRIT